MKAFKYIKRWWHKYWHWVLGGFIVAVMIGGLASSYILTDGWQSNGNGNRNEPTSTPHHTSTPTPTVIHHTPTPTPTPTVSPTPTSTHHGGGGGGGGVHCNPSGAFTVTRISGTGVWHGSTWTVSAYPGETNYIIFRLTNYRCTDIVANASITGNCSVITGAGNYTVQSLNSRDITFTWVVNSSAPIGNCSANISIVDMPPQPTPTP